MWRSSAGFVNPPRRPPSNRTPGWPPRELSRGLAVRGRLRLVSELDALVEDWLTLPQVAERLGVAIRGVRRLLQERQLVAIRRVPTGGSGVELCVPGQLLMDGAPLRELAGTVTLLTDAGYSDEEALVWLFTEDPTLPGSPVEAMRAGRRAEIRRRAQALAF
jgi:hypothetical protein